MAVEGSGLVPGARLMEVVWLLLILAIVRDIVFPGWPNKMTSPSDRPIIEAPKALITDISPGVVMGFPEEANRTVRRYDGTPFRVTQTSGRTTSSGHSP